MSSCTAASSSGNSECRPSSPGSRGSLVDVDRPEPVPPNRGKPGARRDDGGPRDHSGNDLPPTTEPRGGRAWIKTADTADMFPPILQDVDESVPDLTRRAERPHVVAVTPHTAASAEHAIDRLGESDCEALEPSGQGAAILCLDEEVNVIALYREVENPETVA